MEILVRSKNVYKIYTPSTKPLQHLVISSEMLRNANFSKVYHFKIL
jgi:hypothetical protein